MLSKIKTVLFEPRLIGLHFNEKMWKSLVMIVVAVLIALLPALIQESYKNQISSSFRVELIENMQNAKITDAYIEDNILYTNNQHTINYTFFDVVIGGELTFESLYTYTLFFDEYAIKFYISNIESYTITYEQLNIGSLDFSLVKTTSVTEANKLVKIFNYIYQDNKIEITMFIALYYFLDLFIAIMFTAVLMAAISLIFSNQEDVMPFKFKFKTCLNCQYIYLLCVLISFLFSVSEIQYLGIILMTIYTIIATRSVRLVKKKVM